MGRTLTQWLVLESARTLVRETGDAVSQIDVSVRVELDEMTVPEIEQIAVDTDSVPVIEGLRRDYPSVRVIERPEHLWADDVPMNEILLHDTGLVPSEFYLQTHSTNPLSSRERFRGPCAAFWISAPHTTRCSL